MFFMRLTLAMTCFLPEVGDTAFAVARGQEANMANKTLKQHEADEDYATGSTSHTYTMNGAKGGITPEGFGCFNFVLLFFRLFMGG
jgi:hypothetical protein